MLRRLLSVAGAVGLLALVLAWPHASSAQADEAAPSVAVAPISGIVDGQTVTVTVKTASDAPVYEAIARLCRGGVDYAPSNGDFPANDFTSDGANCPGPSHPVSTSSDASITDTLTGQNAARPQGESFSFRVGSGIVEWTDTNANTTRSLSCDDKNACSLVVELQYQTGPESSGWKPYVFPIGYGVSDPIAGCGGPASDIVSTGGSDRMTEAWINWTVAACKQAGAHGAPTKLSFLGEGEAVQQFNLGALDMAYSASGYDPKFGFVPDGDPALPNGGRRPVVAIPLALNAAVIAVGGGVRTSDNHKAPFTSIQMTAAEASAMFAGGPIGVEQNAPDSTSDNPKSFEDDLKARNSELFQAGLFDSSAGFPVGAYADGETFSWYATNYFKTLAPSQWKVPNTPVFQDNAGRARTVDANLAGADPSYIQAITLNSNRSSIRKALVPIGPTTSGGMWLLTDLESANALGLTPVSLANAKGDFVSPNPATLAAALPGMKDDGLDMLTSTPTYTAPANGVTPYPLTFVEYVLAPAEPLVDDDCTTRTASEKLMTNWLSYVTSEDGQHDLPAGMIPLPADMRRAAAAQVKNVGAAPVTGTCAAQLNATTPDLPASLGDAGTTIPSDESIGDSSSFVPRVTRNTPLVAARDDSPTSESKPSGIAAIFKPHIPGFAGASGAGWFGAALALVGIVALTTVSLFSSARAK